MGKFWLFFLFSHSSQNLLLGNNLWNGRRPGGGRSLLCPSIPQCWASSSALLGLRLSFYDCEGVSCKPSCSHNKTPDTGDVAPGYCTLLETAEWERGGCSDKIPGAGGSGSSQQVDRQPAAGQAFLSAGVKF